MESISHPAGAFLFLIYDSLRIAGPSRRTKKQRTHYWNKSNVDRGDEAKRPGTKRPEKNVKMFREHSLETILSVELGFYCPSPSNPIVSQSYR
jgi:hypothetical protein